MITFDDGYKSWVNDAIPVLNELGLPATFFISSGFIGLSKEAESKFICEKLFRKLPPRKITGTLSYNDVKRISDEGFVIGGHTVNHCNLSLLRSSDKVKLEIEEDKNKLEKNSPGFKGHGVFYYDYHSLIKPEITRYIKRLESNYRKPVGVNNLLLMTRPNSRPFNANPCYIDLNRPNSLPPPIVVNLSLSERG